MRHVLWIGGPPACGKTSIATRLARRHGLRLHSADTRTWVHRDRALAAGSAAAVRWESLTPAERWEHATVDEMLDMSLHRERGPVVIDDVSALPVSPLIVAEGSVLPASAVASGIAERSRAIWLVPHSGVPARARLTAARTPEGQARLYARLRDVIEREAAEHGAPVLTVDGAATLADTVDVVRRLFAGALDAGPVAQSRPERPALLREMNEAVVAQFRGFFARPWARGDADAVSWRFACECGDGACEEDVVTTIGAAAAGPAVAPGHEVAWRPRR